MVVARAPIVLEGTMKSALQQKQYPKNEGPAISLWPVGSKAAGLCSRTLWNKSFRVAYLKSGLKSDWNAAWHDPEQAIRDQKLPIVADFKQEENKAFFFYS